MEGTQIDPLVLGAVEGTPLMAGHPAAAYAAGLPAAHPVRRLFTGEAQWLGNVKEAYAFLRLFSEVHADVLEKVSAGGGLDAARISPEEIAAAPSALGRSIPSTVLFRGPDNRAVRHELAKLHRAARARIAERTSSFPPVRTLGLDAFDRTFALLVRAVSS